MLSMAFTEFLPERFNDLFIARLVPGQRQELPVKLNDMLKLVQVLLKVLFHPLEANLPLMQGTKPRCERSIPANSQVRSDEPEGSNAYRDPRRAVIRVRHANQGAERIGSFQRPCQMGELVQRS